MGGMNIVFALKAQCHLRLVLCGDIVMVFPLICKTNEKEGKKKKKKKEEEMRKGSTSWFLGGLVSLNFGK
jgi:hypothetical protein